MIHYYINPKTNELIAFDDESREVMPLERVGPVLAVGLATVQPIAPVRKTERIKAKEGSNKRRPRLCGQCRKPGHTYQTCPQYLTKEPKQGGGKPGEATIKRVRELHDEGKTVLEIKQATGLSYAQIVRYRKYTPEPYKAEDELEALEPEDDGLGNEDE
jgi:hypothetical protein